VAYEATVYFVVSLLLYISIMYLGCHNDGLEDVDIWYFISMSMTTVGLGGGTTPRTLTWRGGLIFMLPMGIGIGTFGGALFKANMKVAQEPSTKVGDSAASSVDSDREEQDITSISDMGDHDSLSLEFERQLQWSKILPRFDGNFKTIERLDKTIAIVVLKWIAKYACIIMIGTAFFLGHKREQHLQSRDGDGELTVIDAIFFATSIASTVGYNDKIAPQSDAAKIFLVFYFFVSTFTAGSIVLELEAFYVSRKDRAILNHIGSSTLYVHKADIHYRGYITQADFVLFRLIQTSKVNAKVLAKLVSHFGDVDFDQTGILKIGSHVPSAEQVRQLLTTQDTEAALVAAWEKMQSANHLAARVVLDRSYPRYDVEAEAPAAILKVTSCHGFEEAPELWGRASREAAIIAGSLFLLVGASYLLLSYLGDLPSGISGLYFFTTTISTVGGSLAPATQLARGLSVVMLPFGLVFIGFGAAAVHCYELSRPPSNERETAEEYNDDADFVDVIYNVLRKIKTTVAGKICVVVFKIYSLVFLGAVLFMMCEDDYNPTWTDAMYFSTATATSVGYGDILPKTNIGLVSFSLFTMASPAFLWSLFIIDLSDVWVFDFMAERVTSRVIDSTTWLHRADVHSTGELTQSDYCVFMLQQLQQVDAELMSNLISMFEKLDVDNLGVLWIGEHVASAAQAQECEAQAKRSGRSKMTEWHETRAENKERWAHARHEGNQDFVSSPAVHGAVFISIRAKRQPEFPDDNSFFGSRSSALRVKTHNFLESSMRSPLQSSHRHARFSNVMSLVVSSAKQATMQLSFDGDPPSPRGSPSKNKLSRKSEPIPGNPSIRFLDPILFRRRSEDPRVGVGREISESLDRPPSQDPSLRQDTLVDDTDTSQQRVLTAFRQRRALANTAISGSSFEATRKDGKHEVLAPSTPVIASFCPAINDRYELNRDKEDIPDSYSTVKMFDEAPRSSSTQILREQIARRRGSARDREELERIVKRVTDEDEGVI